MKQLPFELLFELGEWWKVDLFTGERVLATDSEVELWGALMEMANAPRDPVIIEQPTASVDGPTLTKKEATQIMGGTSYIYDQLEIMGQILNIRAFPGIATALQQAALIYDFIGKRFGVAPKPRNQPRAGEPTFADVINAEMKRQVAEPAAYDEPALSAEELAQAEQAAIKEQTDKGGNYAEW